MIAAAKFADIPNFNIKNMNYSNRVVFQSKGRFDKDIAKLSKMAIPEDPFSRDKKCI